MFFLTDHLGSVRVVANQSGTVLQTNQYSPFGDLINDANVAEVASDNRYRFTGKERSAETLLHDFGARYLDSSIGRFTTIDPLAEKYPAISPYSYCAGDPVNMVDPDGQANWELVKKGLKMVAVGTAGLCGSGLMSSTGILTAVGVGLMINSMGTLGIGIAYTMTGILSDPCSQIPVEKYPSSPMNAVGKSLDMAYENEVPYFESTMNIIEGGATLLTIPKLNPSIISSSKVVDDLNTAIAVEQISDSANELVNYSTKNDKYGE